MNKRAKELKAELERLFAAKTREMAESVTPVDYVIEGEDRKVLDDAQATIKETLAGNFRADVLYSVPDEGFSDALRRLLAYRPFATFDGWHVAPDVTDAALLAAESDIRSSNFDALKELRDRNRGNDFEFPMASRGLSEYKLFLNNLRYMLVVLAHQAKRYASYPSARAFLSAASLVVRRAKMIPPWFRETDIEQIVDWIEEGVDELKIAADYTQLEAWPAFSAREGGLFFKENPDTNKTDGVLES